MSLLFLELNSYCVNAVRRHVYAADVLIRRGVDGEGCRYQPIWERRPQCAFGRCLASGSLKTVSLTSMVLDCSGPGRIGATAVQSQLAWAGVFALQFSRFTTASPSK